MIEIIDAHLGLLTKLAQEPTEDSLTLKRVRQSGVHQVWRLSHPYEPGIAVRTIVWFSGSKVVVALLANNKAEMGDVFYNSVGSRADQQIDNYLRANKEWINEESK